MAQAFALWELVGPEVEVGVVAGVVEDGVADAAAVAAAGVGADFADFDVVAAVGEVAVVVVAVGVCLLVQNLGALVLERRGASMIAADRPCILAGSDAMVLEGHDTEMRTAVVVVAAVGYAEATHAGGCTYQGVACRGIHS